MVAPLALVYLSWRVLLWVLGSGISLFVGYAFVGARQAVNVIEVGACFLFDFALEPSWNNLVVPASKAVSMAVRWAKKHLINPSALALNKAGQKARRCVFQPLLRGIFVGGSWLYIKVAVPTGS